MKDEHRLQDKVELLLDHRQIFLLFFASAVIVGLVFALGVVVGKRLESPAASRKPTDPLTLLDQMGKEDSEDGLTFHEALTNDRGQGKKASKLAGEKIATPATARVQPPAPATGSEESELPEKENPHGSAKTPPVVALGKKPSAGRQAPEGGSSSLKHPGSEAKKPEPFAEEKGKIPAKKDKNLKSENQSKHKIIANSSSSSIPASDAEEESRQGVYTLQLSAFQDRKEADQFMQKLRDAGMKPFMVPTTIPQKGIWYRVRVGSYNNWDDAVAAKQAFEKAQKLIAYVAKN